MSRQRFVINDATIVETGADGGHRYLKGRCDWSGDVVDVAVLMRDKPEEAKLAEGTVVVSATVSGFARGSGLLLRDAEVESGT